MRPCFLVQNAAEEGATGEATANCVERDQLGRVQQDFDALGAGVWVQAHCFLQVVRVTGKCGQSGDVSGRLHFGHHSLKG